MRQGLPGKRQGSSRLPLGPSKDQAFKTRPRQEELVGPRRQGPGKRSLPGRPSQSIETPASGVCREGRSRLKVTSLTQDPDKRSLPGRLEDYITGDTPRRYMRPGGARGAASSLARQGQDPGKALAGESCAVCPRSSSSNHASRWGLFQGRVAGGCAAWGTRWHYTVVKPSPWQTETQGRALLGSTAMGIKCSCPPLSK